MQAGQRVADLRLHGRQQLHCVRAPSAAQRAARQAREHDGLMRPLSRFAVGAAADVVEAFSGSAHEMLFTSAGLGRYMPRSTMNLAKAAILARTINAAQGAAERGDEEAAEGLHMFVRLAAERIARDGEDGNPSWERLREALRADGFDPRIEEDSRARLLPLYEPRAPLSDEITALQHDFRRLRLPVADKHYEEAVKACAREDYGAANGQIRTMLEEVVCQLAEREGFDRERAGDGGKAIQYMIDSGKLPKREGGNMVQGLWQMTHTNGPHPGTSTAGEAHFRLQAVTAAARFLIDYFAPT
ncbi:hypothetical protein J7I98_37075 [Streptomyces sp. ISL-98]|uniref:hypothetical protein n=1 Tax=Streptomyces sp. ISL-98 TaxID=2819192 RepID=UPI001BE90E4E|nr:hypothetical protein [Streptomyces sp. ISL-98]MBT2511335.1 hypothetical protein [Streptomyces sp. ISL-98]